MYIPIHAQQSYTINDYGTYIIDSNSRYIKKLPIDQDLFFIEFWKNYAIFFIMGEYSIVVNNTHSNSIIQIINEPNYRGFNILDDELFLYTAIHMDIFTNFTQ
jgi:hypothetical protein